jgi:hypothetical protein
MRGLIACVFGMLIGGASSAAPVESAWPVDGPDDSVAVAAAELSGWYAVADSLEDSVEIRDVREQLIRTITKPEIGALLPWMALDGSQDGPTALAWSDSGRSLFIVVFDSTPAGDGLPSDAVLRYDTPTDTLSLFARAEISDRVGDWPHLSASFFRGRLYVGTDFGSYLIYRALRNDTTGVPIGSRTVPGGGAVCGLAVDRTSESLFVASGSTVYRAELSNPALTLTELGPVAGIRAVSYSEHFGGDLNPGLHVLSGAGPGLIYHVPELQADGTFSFNPTVYSVRTTTPHDLDATACGRLLVGEDDDATMIADDTDTRLGFEDWVVDEFGQVVTFGRSLIAPDGEPDGWVIDGDVVTGGSRFHPPTPDAACWTVLLLIMNDHLFGDPTAQERVRTILKRYANQMPDPYGPGVSGDGHIRHWCDPWSTTGAAKPGWSDEFATLSTMKIVLAASRAQAFYPDDDGIRSAAREIIDRVASWDLYIQPGTDALYFISNGSGPNTSVAGAPFNEGIIFLEEAAAYGGLYSQNAYARWLNRSLWPTAQFVAGLPVTGNWAGGYQAAFLSLYPMLTQSDFRDDPAWQEQVRNLLASNGAWTDDNGPQFMTVFSAGTTKGIWGGYNADSLGHHPGDITTFPSLLAFSGMGQTAPAVGAYNGYRRGARASWDGGAEMLYRRSDVDRAYEPNSAGLPDVGLGGLGLAELIMPGSVDAVLTGEFTTIGCSRADVTTTGAGVGDANYGVPDGQITGADINFYVNAWVAGDAPIADLTTTGAGAGDPGFGVPDGQVTGADINFYVNLWVAGCP